MISAYRSNGKIGVASVRPDCFPRNGNTISCAIIARDIFRGRVVIRRSRSGGDNVVRRIHNNSFIRARRRKKEPVSFFLSVHDGKAFSFGFVAVIVKHASAPVMDIRRRVRSVDNAPTFHRGNRQSARIYRSYTYKSVSVVRRSNLAGAYRAFYRNRTRRRADDTARVTARRSYVHVRKTIFYYAFMRISDQSAYGRQAFDVTAENYIFKNETLFRIGEHSEVRIGYVSARTRRFIDFYVGNGGSVAFRTVNRSAESVARSSGIISYRVTSRGSIVHIYVFGNKEIFADKVRVLRQFRNHRKLRRALYDIRIPRPSDFVVGRSVRTENRYLRAFCNVIRRSLVVLSASFGYHRVERFEIRRVISVV